MKFYIILLVFYYKNLRNWTYCGCVKSYWLTNVKVNWQNLKNWTSTSLSLGRIATPQQPRSGIIAPRSWNTIGQAIRSVNCVPCIGLARDGLTPWTISSHLKYEECRSGNPLLSMEGEEMRWYRRRWWRAWGKRVSCSNVVNLTGRETEGK